jgi:predicted O-methyltransferase YrrM
MNDKLWNEVDDYMGQLVEQDDALRAALDESAKASLPPIHVSPAQGKLPMLLAQVQRARSILEIRTLGACSSAAGFFRSAEVVPRQSATLH